MYLPNVNYTSLMYVRVHMYTTCLVLSVSVCISMYVNVCII